MAQPLILLDTGLLWLVVHPSARAKSGPLMAWMASLALRGYEFAVPEISDYEARRDLIRRPAKRQIANLDALLQAQTTYLPLTTPIMRRAGELWAQVRRAGKPTGADDALDGDVILGAQWEAEHKKGRVVIVATNNLRHLTLFSDARLWSDIH